MKWDALRTHITTQALAQQARHNPDDQQHRRATATLALLPYCASLAEGTALNAWRRYGQTASTRELLTVETLSRRWQADNWAL